jgi:MscS family membrane protein
MLLTAAGALAQSPQSSQSPHSARDAKPPAEAPLDGSAEDETTEGLATTPRAALTRFLELSRRGDHAAAGKLLDLPPSTDPARAPELAMRLRLVLDQKWIDLSKVSSAQSGATGDGLGSGTDEIARLAVDRSLTAPVRLVRRGAPEPRWLFSRMTVERIDDWYALLPNRLLLGFMPEPLLRMGPRSLLLGQWLALPLFILAVGAAGIGLSRLSRRVVRPLVKRTAFDWDDTLLDRVGSPLALALAVAIAYALLPFLGLYPPANSLALRALRAMFFADFFWALARGVDVTERLLARSQWGHGAPSTRAALVFASRFGKTVVAAFALVALFSELGYPVTSLLAGLGVGGIAVALSAQKSLENLIGAFSIAVDQPFREGDVVRVDSLVGTVEMIGMRSTRIRTADRTLVSIPNGKLADMRIETFAARDRIRLAFTFGLTYSTTESQLRSVLTDFDSALRANAKVWPEGCSVRFKELGDSALIIEVGCSFITTDFDEFTNLRQETLLALMKIVERNGAEFAFPTRTLQIANGAAQSGIAPPAVSGQRWDLPPDQRFRDGAAG